MLFVVQPVVAGGNKSSAAVAVNAMAKNATTTAKHKACRNYPIPQ
jgi:hypothetical protein